MKEAEPTFLISDKIRNILNPNTTEQSFQLRSKKAKKKNTKGCCRTLVRFMFSHVGLLILVLLFVITGGFLFQLLEQHAAIQRCEEGQGIYRSALKKYRTYIFNYVWLNMTNLDLVLEANVTEEAQNDFLKQRQINFYNSYRKDIREKLIEFRDEIIEIYNVYKYRGQDCVEDTSWIIESAILFSITLLTTIGYGHVAPITWEGMIVCVCFSMVGIPLFLLSIANLSVNLGDLFRNIYSKLNKKLGINKQNDRELKDQIYETKFIMKNLYTNPNLKSEISRSFPDLKELKAEDFEIAGWLQERSSVPLLIVVFIIVCYLALGSVLFNHLEGWGNIKGLYFAYTTMATIGFGDLVPGLTRLENAETDDKAGRNLIIGGIYLFFGIAILAMCFDLIQEELILKLTDFRKTYVRNSSSQEANSSFYQSETSHLYEQITNSDGQNRETENLVETIENQK